MAPSLAESREVLLSQLLSVMVTLEETTMKAPPSVIIKLTISYYTQMHFEDCSYKFIMFHRISLLRQQGQLRTGSPPRARS